MVFEIPGVYIQYTISVTEEKCSSVCFFFLQHVVESLEVREEKSQENLKFNLKITSTAV